MQKTSGGEVQRLEQLLYTPRETSEITSLSTATIARLMASGELESLKVGRARRVTRDGIEALITRLRAGKVVA